MVETVDVFALEHDVASRPHLTPATMLSPSFINNRAAGRVPVDCAMIDWAE